METGEPLDFVCDKSWDVLQPLQSPAVRHCPSCRKHVFMAECRRDRITAAVLGRCVALSDTSSAGSVGFQGVGMPMSAEPTLSRFRTAIRCVEPVRNERIDMLRMWVPAVFDGGICEQQILEGRPVMQRDLTRDQIDAIRTELAACAPELELLELPLDGKEQLGLFR